MSYKLILATIVVLSGVCVNVALINRTVPDYHKIDPSKINNPFRQTPLEIHSPGDSVQLICPNQEQVIVAFQKSYPRDIKSWSALNHQLRLWGPSFTSSAPSWTGPKMLSLLTNSNLAFRQFGVQIHRVSRHGLSFIPWNPPSRIQGESHIDSTLATLGEIGAPLSTRFLVGSEIFTLEDALSASQRNFSWDQELAFTTKALTYYRPSKTAWSNKHGQIITLDAIAKRLCDIPIGEGSCFGNHDLFALTMLLIADREEHFLEDRTRIRIQKRLTKATFLLKQNQKADGSWNADWFIEVGANRVHTDPNLIASVVATSHALEWLKIAPEEYRLQPDQLEQALTFLTHAIINQSKEQITISQVAFSHAAHALKVWYPDSWDLFVSKINEKGTGDVINTRTEKNN